MDNYELVYFNARGRAEAIRIMLTVAGQAFDDVRYDSSMWAEQKQSTPMQQLPYLKVGSKVICQSKAIQGYVARAFDLNGANNDETTRIEVISSVLDGLLQPLFDTFKAKDEAEKKKLMESMYTEKAPKILRILEDMLKENNGGDAFFLGSKISRGDVIFFTVMESFNNADVLKKYPKLFALKERVAKQPAIQAYLAKRPETKI